LAIARCGSLLAYPQSQNFSPPLLIKVTSLPSVENCRRRRPLHPHFGLITITGIDDYD
jgi:hypothetical protein